MSNTTQMVPKGFQWVNWKKPLAGSVILNLDGAVKLDLGIASAGGLIGDHNGAWIAGFLLKIGRAHTDIGL
ncbi:hypothetical protein GOBAR_AA37206 [Gossypium barbadense]|uniref:RNase H type-1 domain-containing protein n=1 Tax=Gossypium barbadense TaxID=3634 RepID=A0A2P5VXH1_GOSBA|nr:hypothetical protein GOBAR_AA37206 [Gossypium barbadense]